MPLGPADITITTDAVFTGATSGEVTVRAPAVVTPWALTLPPDDGTLGYILRTDGGGVTSWVPPSAGAVGDGDYGDIFVSGSGATWTIDTNVVTYAKMQDVSAASRLLGRGDSGSGDPQEITLGTNLTMTGTTLDATGGGGSMTTDVIADILAMTPTAGAMAFATDTQQMLVADGTSWQADSYFYVQAEEPAMGAEPWPNQLGYGRDYLTDLAFNNCYVGHGTGGDGTVDGEIRFTDTLGQFGQFEQWSVGAWHPIVCGLVLTEVEDLSQAITQTPIGKTEPIVVFNGNSVTLGLNGVPLYLGYVASMGAYPPYQIISGGTF